MKHIPLLMLSCLVLGIGGLSACSSSSSPDDSDSQSQADGDSESQAPDGDSESQALDGDSESQVPDGDSDSESQAPDGDSDSEPAADGDSDSESTSDFDGFAVRVPQPRELVCPGMDESSSETDTYEDVDYLCRIQQSDLDIEIYLQATPTSCSSLSYPLFDADHVHLWLKRNGNITEMTTASYEYGGRHHNDLIDFTLDGKSYELWHSSLGWGGRACAAPDCLIVCKDGTACRHGDGNVATDGCSREAGGDKPPLPILCSQVASDGSVPALQDPWTAAAGADSAILPCGGDLGEGK